MLQAQFEFGLPSWKTAVPQAHGALSSKLAAAMRIPQPRRDPIWHLDCVDPSGDHWVCITNDDVLVSVVGQYADIIASLSHISIEQSARSRMQNKMEAVLAGLRPMLRVCKNEIWCMPLLFVTVLAGCVVAYSCLAVRARQASTSWRCIGEPGSPQVKLSPDEMLRFSHYIRTMNRASDVADATTDEELSESAQDRLRFTPAAPLQGWKSDSPAAMDVATTLECEYIDIFVTVRDLPDLQLISQCMYTLRCRWNPFGN
jgi:hypothetical protein